MLRRRRKKILDNKYNSVTNSVLIEKTIAFIIPTTSNKRNYKKCEDMDFFNKLYKNFLKTAHRKQFKYSFYLGYDDDDDFYINNLENIKNHFESFNNEDKLFLIPMNNLKNKLNQIWNKLAFLAAKDNNFLYQIGDDVIILTSGWEKIFINYLESVNFIGAVGPRDLNHCSICTQSFVHITHLKIYNFYFPPETDNWYVDNWINKIYPIKKINSMLIANPSSEPRYVIKYDIVYFKKISTRDKEKLKFELEKEKNVHFITYTNENDEKILIEQASNFYPFKSIKDYSSSDLDENFKEKNKNVLSNKKNNGYSIWKAYIIDKKLSEIEEGDYLVYCDSKCMLNKKGIKKFKDYLQLLQFNDKPIISFILKGLKEKRWTNDKVFEYFNINLNSEKANNDQIYGGVKILKKCNYTVNLFKKILKVLEDDNLLFTDEYNQLTTREEFKVNRYEQSIESIVLKLEGTGVEIIDEICSKDKINLPIYAPSKNDY